MAYWITGKTSEFFPRPNRRWYLRSDVLSMGVPRPSASRTTPWTH